MRKLDNIQALRGVACLLVAVLHVFQLPLNGGGSYLSVAGYAVLENLGVFGVDIFFVVSGVLIAMQVQRKSDGFASARDFAVRRFFRLFPAFWLILAISLLARWYHGTQGEVGEILGNPWQLLLLYKAPALGVSWTLPYEINFYIVAALALFAGRYAWLVLAAWSVYLLVAWVGWRYGGWDLNPQFFRPLSIEFIFGLAIGWMMPIRFKYPSILAVVGFSVPFILCLIFTWEVVYFPTIRHFSVGFFAALVVVAFMAWETNGRLAPRWLVWLGDISYSLYLIHYVVYEFTFSYWRTNLTSNAGALSYIVVNLTLAIALSYLCYRWFETPINQWAARVTHNANAPSRDTAQPTATSSVVAS